MSDAILSFLIAVAGGVTCHYIIKWLDSDDKDKYPKENPRVAALGFSLLRTCRYSSFCLLALYIISI